MEGSDGGRNVKLEESRDLLRPAPKIWLRIHILGVAREEKVWPLIKITFHSVHRLICRRIKVLEPEILDLLTAAVLCETLLSWPNVERCFHGEKASQAEGRKPEARRICDSNVIWICWSRLRPSTQDKRSLSWAEEGCNNVTETGCVQQGGKREREKKKTAPLSILRSQVWSAAGKEKVCSQKRKKKIYINWAKKEHSPFDFQ